MATDNLPWLPKTRFLESHYAVRLMLDTQCAAYQPTLELNAVARLDHSMTI